MAGSTSGAVTVNVTGSGGQGGAASGMSNDIAGDGGAGTAMANGATSSGSLNVGATAIGGAGGDATTGGLDKAGAGGAANATAMGAASGPGLVSVSAFATGGQADRPPSIPFSKAPAEMAAAQPPARPGRHLAAKSSRPPQPPAARAATEPRPAERRPSQRDQFGNLDRRRRGDRDLHRDRGNGGATDSGPGATGQANADSMSQNGGGTVQASANSPGGGPASAMSVAAIEPGAHPIEISPGQTVSAAFLTGAGAAGEMSAGYGGEGETLVYETTADFSFTTTQPDPLYLTLVNFDATGDGFDSLELTVSDNADPNAPPLDFTFSSLRSAEEFFRDNRLDLGFEDAGPQVVDTPSSSPQALSGMASASAIPRRS